MIRKQAVEKMIAITDSLSVIDREMIEFESDSGLLTLDLNQINFDCSDCINKSPTLKYTRSCLSCLISFRLTGIS